MLVFNANLSDFVDIDFSRKQLMMFRKFVLGQCNKQMLTQVPFKDCNLSSKRLFDDTYLYFMEQQNQFHRGLPEVALGIYELMNHTQLDPSICPETGNFVNEMDANS